MATKPMKEKRKAFNITLTPSAIQKLIELSDRDNRSPSSWVENVVTVKHDITFSTAPDIFSLATTKESEGNA